MPNYRGPLMVVYLPAFVLAVLAFETSRVSGNVDERKGVNQRSGSVSTLSAQDQGTSKVDIEITQKIRRSLVKQASFSRDAKNLKIITVHGLVTLKGPVSSAAEKAEIEKLAKGIAGKSKVISEIVIN